MSNATASRWGAGAIVLALVAINWFLPDRYRLLPPFLPGIAAGLVIAAMVLSATMVRTRRWHGIERMTMSVGVGIALLFNAANLISVVDNLVTNPSSMKPVPLFYTSVSIWTGNMLIFTLIYWLLDRGGPDARAGKDTYPDFDFPAMDDSEKVRPGWQPGIVDYLFLGFTTSTAFSPTEAMPLTPRAKLLVIVQSSISLITIAVVAARTVNILQ